MKNVILLLLPALLILGCGPEPREKLYPVKGIVTVDGAPLPTGTVTFHPVAGAAGSRVILGLIESGGVYVAQTDGEPGVPAGEYAVTVHASLATDSTKPPEDLVAAHFGDPAKSGLKVTVQEKAPEGAYDLKVAK